MMPFSTTLNMSIHDSSGWVTLNNSRGLPHKGRLIIDRIDSNGILTPSKQEVVEYYRYHAFPSPKIITFTKRGDDRSTVQAHAAGALVELLLSSPEVSGEMTLKEFLNLTANS